MNINSSPAANTSCSLRHALTVNIVCTTGSDGLTDKSDARLFQSPLIATNNPPAKKEDLKGGGASCKIVNDEDLTAGLSDFHPTTIGSLMILQISSDIIAFIVGVIACHVKQN